jgi:hypothetical protein
LVLIFCNIFANEIFENKCASCHIKKRGKVLTQSQKDRLLAPPIYGVVKHIKDKYPMKKDFVKFVSLYITNPNKSKSLCKEKTIIKFGLMPSIGKSMTKYQKDEVANYIFSLGKI